MGKFIEIFKEFGKTQKLNIWEPFLLGKDHPKTRELFGFAKKENIDATNEEKSIFVESYEGS